MVDVVLNKVTHFIMKSTYPYLEVQNYSTTPHKLQPAGWDQDEKGGQGECYNFEPPNKGYG